MPRQRAQNTLAKNQLDLAIALSSSLEESRTFQLSKQAEELPPSAIEDGAIPQNIKQMQKEFLDRLKPPQARQPKRSKSKKLGSSSVIPLLLTRSAEERLRIVTEKVALILIQDNNDEASPNSLLAVDDEGNTLWNKSYLTPSEKEGRMSYYVTALAAFVSTSDVEIGNKLNTLGQLPGILKTPVRCKTKATHFISQTDSQRDQDFQRWSDINQISNKVLDQDIQVQAEFVNDWQRMLNNSTMSDMTIILKDGIEMPAHKLVIYSRCPAMLLDLNDDNYLVWNALSYNEALAFLGYVYSGQLAAIRSIHPECQGIEGLARKYQITELLKLLLALGSADIMCNFSQERKTEEDKKPFDANMSNDLFADANECDLNIASNLSGVDTCVWEKNETDEYLLEEFFGTLNPALSQDRQSHTSTPFQCSGNKDMGLTDEVFQQEQIDSDHEFSTKTSESFNDTGKESTSSRYGTSNRSLLTPSPVISKRQHSDDIEAIWSSKKLRIDNNTSNNSSSEFHPSHVVHCAAKSDSPVTSRSTSNDAFHLDNSVGECNGTHVHESLTLPNQSLENTVVYHQFTTPKTIRNIPVVLKNFTDQKLLEDSFTFDMNDSDLIRQSERRCLSPVGEVIVNTPLRTPLEDVKTSNSPITPLPDFKAMSDEQFEMELLRFGLKRKLTRNKGIKMLKHIYGKLHPIAEVVNHRGKQLFLPVGSKSPTENVVTLSQDAVVVNIESSSEDDDMVPVPEESINDLDDPSPSQEVIGELDLKSNLKLWLANQPEIYERILRYEPIWLASIHLQFKEYLNKNIKLNHLMDALDEEGITFRLAQGQTSGRRRNQSPKKKASPTKKKGSPKKGIHSKKNT